MTRTLALRLLSFPPGLLEHLARGDGVERCSGARRVQVAPDEMGRRGRVKVELVREYVDAAETGKRAAMIVALVLAVAGCVFAWPGNRTAEAVAEEVSGPWKPWSPDALASARAEGRAVFVDFTAAVQWPA